MELVTQLIRAKKVLEVAAGGILNPGVLSD